MRKEDMKKETEVLNETQNITKYLGGFTIKKEKKKQKINLQIPRDINYFDFTFLNQAYLEQ